VGGARGGPFAGIGGGGGGGGGGACEIEFFINLRALSSKRTRRTQLRGKGVDIRLRDRHFKSGGRAALMRLRFY